MSPGKPKLPSQSAALAGVPAGVQAIGPWAGRRQLFVRFASEAETATIYTAAALAGELARLSQRSRYHSIAIAGRDPLAEHEFLCAALDKGVPLPVMLDHDGQRPDALRPLLTSLALVQVTLDGTEGDAVIERALETVRASADRKIAHALAVVPADGASDARLLQIVEQAHAASAEVAVVVHPSVASAAERDRRWTQWLERAMAVHEDVRLLAVLPSPTGTR